MVAFFMLTVSMLTLFRYHFRLTNQPFYRPFRPVFRAFSIMVRGYITTLQQHQNNNCYRSYCFIKLFLFFHINPHIVIGSAPEKIVIN